MKKENGKVLTGCILSGLAFLGLFLPSFTTYEVNVSYYGRDARPETFFGQWCQ